MERINRDEKLNIIFYIISIITYLIISVILYLTLYRINPYYLFVAIPSLFLFIILTINNLIKTILTILLMGLNKHGNYTSVEKMERAINVINDMTKSALVATFISLLTSIMILDITLCLYRDKILLLSLSLVGWFLIYYFIFDLIIYKIKLNARN